VDRPTGDLRLNDGPLSGAKRISSIAGILGILKLKLGKLRQAPIAIAIAMAMWPPQHLC
jgi:hypothetical protein